MGRHDVRAQLLYDPILLLERLAKWPTEKRRQNRPRATTAQTLQPGQIDSFELLEFLQPLDPRVIYDVGANVGTWTLLAKGLYPQAEVHAFEPLATHVAKFC